ncbi:F0F1 ATP synthase subunit A [Sphingomicrobium flavum]|uniref:F0F1 ATP synthase subunit A n=1 Tax=Sphingomicrobium flavum TaxID=1229164 RepID=UPI0021AE1644|nr:F0F1 ATP synthase subunit A [Sphingomicrobium flavum]
MAEESGKIDPMYQFEVTPLFGEQWEIAGYAIPFTNSALWMALTLLVLWLFMLGGMKRELIPGRWQMAVEGVTGFISDMVDSNIGEKGKKYVPYIFSLFMFILFANMLGMLPTALVGIHAFTVTSHLTVTAILAMATFLIVLVVGFGTHGIKFFGLFVPHGTPLVMIPIIFVIELISFLVRPFSLAVRLFVAMTAGHVLLKVLAGFVINAGAAGAATAAFVSVPSFILMIGISLLEVLIAFIQAYVFALLASSYLNDAINLH